MHLSKHIALFSFATLVGVNAMIGGCGTGTNAEMPPEEATKGSSVLHGASFPPSILTTPSDFVDPSGRQWLWKGAAIMAPPGAELSRVEPPDDVAKPDDTQLSPAELREKIARKMKPVRVIAGNVYTLAEPDYALVDQVLAMKQAPSTSPGDPTRASQVPKPPIEVDLDGLKPARIYSNPDARQRSYTPTAAWFAPHARLHFANCTATLIGPTTAITAAHCMYNPATGTYFYAGMYPGENLVNGQFVYASPGPYNPVQTWFTTGWYYDSDYEWDYGVLDFYGGSTPGNDWGWYGTVEPSTTDYVGTHYNLGYPVETKPAGEQWYSMSCCRISTYASGRRFNQFLDQEKGNSGGCNYGNDYRCFGITSTGSYYYDYNTSRRWNADTYNFVHAYAHWP